MIKVTNGINCSEVRDILISCYNGDLSLSDTKEVYGHLSQCSDCAKEFAYIKRMCQLLESEHLRPEAIIESYLDGTTPQRSIGVSGNNADMRTPSLIGVWGGFVVSLALLSTLSFSDVRPAFPFTLISNLALSGVIALWGGTAIALLKNRI